MFKDTVHTLKALYIEGGITVWTILEPDGTITASSFAPDNKKKVMAKTLIQPDADIVTKIHGDVLNRNDIWKTHLKNVKSCINPVFRIRILAARISNITGIAGIFITVLGWQTQKEIIIFGLFTAVFSFFFRHIAERIFRGYIRRKIFETSPLRGD